MICKICGKLVTGNGKCLCCGTRAEGFESFALPTDAESLEQLTETGNAVSNYDYEPLPAPKKKEINVDAIFAFIISLYGLLIYLLL